MRFRKDTISSEKKGEFSEEMVIFRDKQFLLKLFVISFHNLHLNEILADFKIFLLKICFMSKFRAGSHSGFFVPLKLMVTVSFT